MDLADLRMDEIDDVAASLQGVQIEPEDGAKAEKKSRSGKRKPVTLEAAPSKPIPQHFFKEPPGEDPAVVAKRTQKQKLDLLDKILRYRDRFPDLKSRNKGLTIKSQLSELEDEVHYMEQQRSQSTKTEVGNPAGVLLVTGCYGIEQALTHYNPMGLRLHGLGNTVQQNMDQFEPLLDELMIKYGTSLGMPVEVRLGVVLATTMLTVHSANLHGGSEALKKMQARMSTEGL